MGKDEGTVPEIDWSRVNVIDIDERYGHALLPAELDDTEEDGLYDHMVDDRSSGAAAPSKQGPWGHIE